MDQDQGGRQGGVVARDVVQVHRGLATLVGQQALHVQAGVAGQV